MSSLVFVLQLSSDRDHHRRRNPSQCLLENDVPKGIRLYKSLLVAYYEGRRDRGKYSHLVESIFLLLLREIVHLDLLEGIDMRVSDPLNLVDG